MIKGKYKKNKSLTLYLYIFCLPPQWFVFMSYKKNTKITKTPIYLFRYKICRNVNHSLSEGNNINIQFCKSISSLSLRHLLIHLVNSWWRFFYYLTVDYRIEYRCEGLSFHSKLKFAPTMSQRIDFNQSNFPFSLISRTCPFSYLRGF